MALFINRSMQANIKIRDDLACTDSTIMECLFIQLCPSLASKHTIVGVIYRPPNTDTLKFSDKLSEILDKVNKENRNFYIMGDFNVDLLKQTSNNHSQVFLNVLLSNSFYP